MAKTIYDSTVARIAGNIAAGIALNYHRTDHFDGRILAVDTVALARLIVAEVKRTEPKES